MSRRVKIGDIFEIPLSNNRKAYGQYVYFDNKQGPLIQVFKHISDDDEIVDSDTILNSGSMFPPIIVGLFAAVKKTLWKVIDNRKIENFKYPGFISTIRNPKTNEATIWFFWDGNNWTKLGRTLEDKYKSKEFLAVYSPYDVPSRIETGKNPYEELINKATAT